MAFGSNFGLARANPSGVVLIVARYTGGGAAADCTRSAGQGAISSITYNAATGAYRITFSGVAGTYLGCWVSIEAAGTTGGMRVANVTKSTYSASARTLDIFVTDVATPTAKDLATDETLCVLIAFAEHGA